MGPSRGRLRRVVDRVLFVADQLANAHRTPDLRHPGGAELTDDAAFEACPFPLAVRRFSELDLRDLVRYDVILLGNSQRASREQLAAIAKTRRHVCFEHDLRICQWRGNFPASRDPIHSLGQRCWCPHLEQRELYRTARGVIFLTRRQERLFLQNAHFRASRRVTLGSSLFSRATLESLERLAARDTPRRGALHLFSPDRIKGTALAREHCEREGLSSGTIAGASPEAVLELLALARVFVHLPIGLEPAGRMPVEARLAGCEVVVNANVGVCGEPWWKLDRAGALRHLHAAPRRFWGLVEELASAEVARDSDPVVARFERFAQAGLRGIRVSGNVLPRWPTAPTIRRRAFEVERYAPW